MNNLPFSFVASWLLSLWNQAPELVLLFLGCLSLPPLALAVGFLRKTALASRYTENKNRSACPTITEDFQKYRLLEKHIMDQHKIQLVFDIPPTIQKGQLVVLRYRDQGGFVTRTFTAVTTTAGKVSLIVNVLRPCQKFRAGGKMSQYLDRMDIGDSIEMKSLKWWRTESNVGRIAMPAPRFVIAGMAA